MPDFKKVDWDESYRLNVPEIDAQHIKLVKMINDLYDIIIEYPEAYTSKSPKILKELLDYTDYHFKFEENNYFRKYGYEVSDLHVSQHNSFVRNIEDRINTAASNISEGKELYRYLVTWLLHHIAKSDKAWALFVLPKMGGSAPTNGGSLNI